MTAKAIMIQGTMSNAGKSLIAAGLCRIFHEDGYRVAPFKSQNMALNSFITDEGLEMGRAQVVQAEAAGLKPSVRMNPILLKPTTDMGSQVIVMGKPVGNMEAREYYKRKLEFVPQIMEAYSSLAAENDIIVIEGAGSPAEINLKQDDIVNMGMAKMADAAVLLVGDIDRGGVFAQLYGTVKLLDPDEQDRIKGLIINKFRGDPTILDPGIEMIEDLVGKKVIGVVPYMDITLEDEDSLSDQLARHTGSVFAASAIDIAVIRFPKISNFTDFEVFDLEEDVSLRFVTSTRELGHPDVVILPGTKSTISDLLWMRENGLEAAVLHLHAQGTFVYGICGGYQMLGIEIRDPEGAERKGTVAGMGLLPEVTTFALQKTMRQYTGISKFSISELTGHKITGYEVHMGTTERMEGDGDPDAQGFAGHVEKTVKSHAGESVEAGQDVEYIAGVSAGIGETAESQDYVSVRTGLSGHMGYSETESNKMNPAGLADCDEKKNPVLYDNKTAAGSYLHGIFDEEDFRSAFLEYICKRKGVVRKKEEKISYAEFKEREYCRLAEGLRKSLDMNTVYRILGMRKDE